MNLDPWRRPVGYSDPGARRDLFDDLPQGPKALAGVVQGVLMHEHVASTYGLKLTARQHAQAHVRPVEGMLDGIAGHDSRPLTDARAADQRQVGVCRHFTLMHVAMLRDQGTAARARCGFATYFTKGKFIDHWVTEYWCAERNDWRLADAQLDPHQCRLFGVDFDPLDVPRDRFMVAGDAWKRCRDGTADPGDFGILNMFGAWFVAGNVVRDVAALNNHEMLPWDAWGGMPANDSEVDQAFIDRLAAVSRRPDANADDLARAYADSRVAVPATVFNAVLKQTDKI